MIANWNGTYSNPAKPRLSCGCCRAEKHERNGDARCTTCVTVGCEERPWGGYKAMPGCLRKAKVKKQAANYRRAK